VLVPILLDTTVYLFAIRSEDDAAFVENRFMPLVFRTYVSGVVVEELYAGARYHQAVRLVERYVGALERAGRVMAPNFQYRKEAGKTHCAQHTTRTYPQVENSTDPK
jgi:predicted nucleic acid-binding protein